MKTAVIETLERYNIHYSLKSHEKTVYTSEDAARERGVRLSQIVKTMLLSSSGGEVVVAVLPGDKRLDVKKVRKLTELKDLRFMDKWSVEQKLGLVVGAIAPIGDHLHGLRLFVDPTVFAESLIDISSGQPTAGLELSSEDLKTLLKDATIAEITK